MKSGILRSGYRQVSEIVTDFRYRLRAVGAQFHSKYLTDVLFVHINKTAGSSIERALGLPFQHRTARELRKLVGRKRWNECFTFAFVRNPWDKVVSHYHFRVKTDQTGLGNRHLDFNEWVMRAYGDRDPRYYDEPRMFMPQVDWISDESGETMVDFVGRFERLEEDFAELCRRIGRSAELPHVKSSDRPGYRQIYSEPAARVIRRHFAPDIRRFEYEY